METRTNPTLGVQLLFLCAFPGIMHAQQWVPVAGAVGGMNFCQAISVDTCQAAATGGRLYTTHDGGVSFDSTQTIFTTEWFNDMHFPTPQVGFACGGTHYGYHTSIIAKTEDGGATWFPLTYNELPWYTLNSIRFFNAEIGLVSGNVGTFLRTGDGGNTFIPVSLPIPGYNNVRDINFDGDVAYICTRATKYFDDENDDDYYHILKSTDMGQSWTVIYSDTVLNRTITTDRGINSVRFLGNFGMACGYNGLLLRTADGGETWMESTIAADVTTLFGIELVNDELAFITTHASYAGLYGNTLRTDDGGLTWAVMPEKFISISVMDGVGYAINDAHQLFKNTQIVNGVAEVDRASLSIFPNPAGDMVHVRMPQAMATGILTVHDLNGRILLEEPIRNGDQFSIPTTGLAAGAYMVEVREKGSATAYRQRLILQ